MGGVRCRLDRPVNGAVPEEPCGATDIDEPALVANALALKAYQKAFADVQTRSWPSPLVRRSMSAFRLECDPSSTIRGALRARRR